MKTSTKFDKVRNEVEKIIETRAEQLQTMAEECAKLEQQMRVLDGEREAAILSGDVSKAVDLEEKKGLLNVRKAANEKIMKSLECRPLATADQVEAMRNNVISILQAENEKAMQEIEAHLPALVTAYNEYRGALFLGNNLLKDIEAQLLKNGTYHDKLYKEPAGRDPFEILECLNDSEYLRKDAPGSYKKVIEADIF